MKTKIITTLVLICLISQIQAMVIENRSTEPVLVTATTATGESYHHNLRSGRKITKSGMTNISLYTKKVNPELLSGNYYRIQNVTDTTVISVTPDNLVAMREQTNSLVTTYASPNIQVLMRR